MPGMILPSSACRVSARGISTAAPISGPQTVPTPPNIATVSAWARLASIPAAAAANSFCRIAISVRPKREFSTASEMPKAMASRPSATRVKPRGSVNCSQAQGSSRFIGSETS